MDKHTTFKIGGMSDCFVTPKDTKELIFVLKSAKRHLVPVFVLGKGSNILVSDKGIEGAVVSLVKMDAVKVEKNKITSECGANLSAVCIAAQKSGLSGLEFAYGIPGTVGGALFMNAGAYGGDMSGVVEGTYCLDENFNEIYLKKDEMDLSYRHSVFQKEMIITKVVFSLEPGDKEVIFEKMDELIKRRKEKQPLEFPSAGSTFKRPEGNYAGTLIEKSGLKGARCGGAMVSEKHSGFVINKGYATCADVLELCSQVQKIVKEKTGYVLELEPVILK